MAQNKILTHWAELINEAYDKDPDFNLTEFLASHNLFVDMLLVVPNQDICSALINCKDFDISKINKTNIKMYRWEILQICLINYDKTNELLIGRLTKLFKGLDNGCTLTGAEIGFGIVNEEYPVSKLFHMIVEYCENNSTNIPIDIMKIVLKTTIRCFSLLHAKQISIIIKYAFKQQILEDEIFKMLIHNDKTKLLLYAMRLYQRRSIKFEGYTDFSDNACELAWLLHQNIPIENLHKVTENYSSFDRILNKSALIHAALWMDEKQRFSSVKDTTLLHFRPTLIHIREFLF